MTNLWDPAYWWRQSGKIFRAPAEPQVQQAPAAPIPSTGSLLSSRDLVLISGAAAFGGAVVAAAIYGAPLILAKYQLQCPVCGCDCCSCFVAHQHPMELLKKLLTRISSSLDAGKERIQRAAGIAPKIEAQNAPKTEVQNEDQSVWSNLDNNGSWTCIQVCRDNGTTSMEVEEAQATTPAGSVPELHIRPDLPDPYSAVKREGYLSWDDYFMSIAFLSAQRSKDPVRQVGACLVSQDHVILGIGYNGFPRGCSDDKLSWAKLSRDGDQLKTKYPYVCHAEVNAILNKNHASASGQRLYVTMFPCNECAKVIIQAGIVEIIFYTDKQAHPDFQYVASRKLLSMANIKVRQHQPKAKSIILQF